jgi:pyrimidine deaminase RibD-like protein
MTFTSDDKHFMARALELAERGRYSSKPNPSALLFWRVKL